MDGGCNYSCIDTGRIHLGRLVAPDKNVLSTRAIEVCLLLLPSHLILAQRVTHRYVPTFTARTCTGLCQSKASSARVNFAHWTVITRASPGWF